MFNDKKVSVLIVAAGTGSRMGGDIPKQYLKVAGKSILDRTIEKFEKNIYIDEIVLVVNTSEIDFIKKGILKKYKKIKKVIKGGNSRTESVKNGIYLMEDSCDIILIHDGVRPFISQTLINSCVETCNDFNSCIPVINVLDTIKVVDDGYVQKTLDRNILKAVQTPQTFSYELIKSCYDKVINEENVVFTDDASIVEYYGYKVKTIDGLVKNIKITTQFDLNVAEIIASMV